MAFHTEYPLRSPRITQILNLFLAIPAPKATGTKSMISGEDSQILNLVPTRSAAVCTIIADERTITKEEEICIGVEEGTAGVASKAIDVPPVTSSVNVSL